MMTTTKLTSMLVIEDRNLQTNQNSSKTKMMNLMTMSNLDCGSQGNLHLKSSTKNGDDSPFLIPRTTQHRESIAEIRSLLELHNTPADIARKTKIDIILVTDLISQLNRI